MTIRDELDRLPEEAQRILKYAHTHEIQRMTPLISPGGTGIDNSRFIAVHLGDSDPRFEVLESAGAWSIVQRKE